MSSYSRFIEDPTIFSSVLEWFRGHEPAPEETPADYGAVLFYRSLGALKYKTDGSIDADQSPLVTVILPRIRRGILWTVGEVHFRPTPLREQFPALFAVRRSFLKWLAGHPLVFQSHPTGAHQFDYYLEGSSQNWGSIHAMPTGLNALRSERYFVVPRE
jgi:hypothetical protein